MSEAEKKVWVALHIEEAPCGCFFLVCVATREDGVRLPGTCEGPFGSREAARRAAQAKHDLMMRMGAVAPEFVCKPAAAPGGVLN
jgi:hypothetical protein